MTINMKLSKLPFQLQEVICFAFFNHSLQTSENREVTNRNISSLPNDTMKTSLPFVAFVSSHFQGNLLETTLASKV